MFHVLIVLFRRIQVQEEVIQEILEETAQEGEIQVGEGMTQEDLQQEEIREGLQAEVAQGKHLQEILVEEDNFVSLYSDGVQ